MNVMGFKLINGQELIGCVEDVDASPNFYTVEKCLIIVYSQSQQGIGVGLHPVSLSADMTNPEAGVTINLNKSAVAYTFKVDAQQEANYRTTTSGLIIAPAGRIK